MTAVNVSPFMTLWRKNCVRESANPFPADPKTVHMNPIAYFPLGTPVGFVVILKQKECCGDSEKD